MIRIDAINGKRYDIATSWHDITIEQAKQVAKVELPKNYIDLYTVEDKGKVKVSETDIFETFPLIQSKVLTILSDMPEDIAMQLDITSQANFYNNYLAKLHFGILNFSFESYPLEKLSIGLSDFYPPQRSTLNGYSLPLAYETAGAFCDCMDMISIKDDGFSSFLSILMRKKDEKYNENIVIKRSEMFNKVDMSTFAYVFNEYAAAVEHIDNNYKWIFTVDDSGSKLKSAYKRSGLEDFGAIGWIYEVAESGMAGTIQQIKEMPLYDFISVLSYLRCINKFEKYASKS